MNRNEFSDAELDIGSMGGFSCYGVGVPEPSITWYKADGSRLPSHFAQDGDGNLRIKGKYQHRFNSENIYRSNL